ncbi:MAG: bacteriohemerythrin [Methylomonas sp.]
MAGSDLVEIFPWNENFPTGIPQIDEQHQQLVHLLNQLASHVVEHNSTLSLDKILDQLADYAYYHFQAEENIWHEYLVDDEWAQEHISAHREFIESVKALQKSQVFRPTENLLEEILSFLTHWLAFHILESDKRLAKTVSAIQSGLSLEQAKVKAAEEMSGAAKLLIETILGMYDMLSARTLRLTREMMERQKAEANLRMAANVVENTLDAICIADENFRIIDVNPALCRLVELERDAIVGMNFNDLNSGLADENTAARIWSDVVRQGHWRGEIWNRRRNGDLQPEWLTLSAVKDDIKGVSNYVGIFSSVSQLLEQHHNLQRIAHHDALTGLPNRLLLADRLSLAIANAQRNQAFLAVCYLDLDGFKQVNDNYGHAAGDLLLKEIAQRIKKNLRGEDTVARLGGDEFALLLVGMKFADDYRDLLGRIIHKVSQPVDYADNAVKVSASIGVTIYPLDQAGPDELLRHADQAMYAAKQQGKSQYSFYRSP